MGTTREENVAEVLWLAFITARGCSTLQFEEVKKPNPKNRFETFSQ